MNQYTGKLGSDGHAATVQPHPAKIFQEAWTRQSLGLIPSDNLWTLKLPIHQKDAHNYNKYFFFPFLKKKQTFFYA